MLDSSSPAASNSAEFARVPRPSASDRVPGSCAWNARTPGTPCSRDFSPRHDKGNADGEKSRPAGRIEIVRSGRHDVTALQLSRFLPPSWFDSNSKRWVRIGREGGRTRGRGIVGRNGSRSGLFSILRDDIWEDLDGMKGWVSNRENFEKIFRIFGIFGIGKMKLNLDFERRKYFGNIWWYGIGRKSTWEWFFSLMDVFEEWSWTVRILGKKQVTPENYTRGNFRFFGESST